MLVLIIKLWIICGLAWWPVLASVTWDKTKSEEKIIPELVKIYRVTITIGALVISLLIWPTVILEVVLTMFKK